MTENTAIIKDSGNRREFETGAVRDMQKGKGRCDLLPLDVVSKIFFNNNDCGSKIMSKLYRVLEILRETRNVFIEESATTLLVETLELFCTAKAFDDIPTMLLELAIHFEQGAKKYGEYNWQKGIPPTCYIDSAVRHYLKWLRGDTDERHDRAFVWNIVCCIWEVNHHGVRNEKHTETVNAESGDSKLFER